MPDTSLDDFLSGEESTGEDETSEDAASEADSAGVENATAGVDSVGSEDDTVDEDRTVAEDGDAVDDGEQSVEPAVSTYDFSPEGAPCAGCGESVEKRWRSEAGLVCPDCKEW